MREGYQFVKSLTNYLVIMRCTNEYHGSLSRYVESASGADFSKEDLCDYSPKEHKPIIREVRLGDGWNHEGKRKDVSA